MKNDLRKIAKEKRNSLNCMNLSLKIRDNLFSLKEFKNAYNILCYYSFSSEVYTINYFENLEKNWFLPKISGNNLIVCPYKHNNLIKNQYNIQEPNSLPIKDLSVIDLIIIPCICADKHGYRIGYGKGYYDRFLKTLPHKPVKIVLTYSDLLFESIYPEKFDESCDIVVSDKEIIKIYC